MEDGSRTSLPLCLPSEAAPLPFFVREQREGKTSPVARHHGTSPDQEMPIRPLGEPACPRDDPSRQEGRRPVRQPVSHFPAFRQSTATSLIQEGNWSRSSARVCSQAKIRWYGYLGESGNTTPRFYTARVCAGCLAYSAWTPDFRSAFQVSPISSRLTCRRKGGWAVRWISKRLNRSRSSIKMSAL